MSSDSALTPKWYTDLLGFGLYKIKALIEIVVISHTATVGRQAPPTDVPVASVALR